MNRICNSTIDKIFSTGQWIWNHPSRIQTAVNLIGLATIGIANTYPYQDKIQQIAWETAIITSMLGHGALIFGSVFAENSTYLKKIVIRLFDISATALITRIASHALMPDSISMNDVIGVTVFISAKFGMQKYKEHLDHLTPQEDLPVPQDEIFEITEEAEEEEEPLPRLLTSFAG